MSRYRQASAVVSVVLLGFAALLMGHSTLLPPAVAGAIQRAFEGVSAHPRIALALVGAGFVVIALAAIQLNPEASGTHRMDHESIVSGVSSATAGQRLDADIDALSAADGAAEDIPGLRDELRGAARTVLHQTTTLSDDEIEASLGDGSWTDDPQASAFLSGTSPPLGVRFREWLRLKPAQELRVRRTVRALEERLDTTGRTTDVTGLDADPVEVGDPQADDEGLTDPASDATAVTVEAEVPDATLDSLRGSAQLIEHWGTLVTAGLFAVALGLLTATRAPVVLGIVAIAYTLPKYVAQPPLPTLKLRRTVADERPLPGDRVGVRVEIENVGDRTVPDLRVIDLPPAALAVSGGSPSIMTALRPGETDAFSYELRAKRGEFAFGGTTVLTRGLGNVRQHELSLDLESRLSCHTLLEEFELQEQSALRIGSVKTDEGGSGVEFHSTREYREGDPLKRVDWNRLAKTGELTTVTFREHRAATVTLVLDRRDAARVATDPTELDGVDLCVYAAERTFLDLLDRGIEVGLIAVDEGLTAVHTGAGAAQRARIQTQLRAATDRYAAALGADQVTQGATVQTRDTATPEDIRSYVPLNAQIIALSPLVDDYGYELIEQLRAFGTPVTLLSPAVVGDGSVGARLRRVERECRLQAIRDTGTRVIDWSPDEAIETAVGRATAHWS